MLELTQRIFSIPKARRTALMIDKVSPIMQAPNRIQIRVIQAATASATFSSCVYFISVNFIEVEEVRLLQSL